MISAKKLLAVIMAFSLFTGCSREGFEASLHREPLSSSNQEQSSSQSERENDSDYIFELDADELAEGSSYYYYARPRAVTEKAEEAAEKIAAKIDSTVFSLPDEVAAERDIYNFTLADAVTINNGEFFSVLYEISYRSEKESEKENYALGMVFDSVTGARKKLEDFIDLDVAVTLITDSQGSIISGRDEELVSKKRNYLSEQGSKKLKKRLSAEGGLDVLLNASFYIEGNELVCVFAAPQEIGGVVEVSVKL